MARKILTGLNSKAYEHPFDRQALTALQKMPGISLLLKKINEYGIDRLLRLQSYGSEIKVTERNFPELYRSLEAACQILDVSPFPELYFFRGSGNIQTYIVGVEKPIIGINFDGMKLLNAEELIYIFGYEAARIKSQHMIYHQMAVIMPTFKTVLSSTTLGFGGLLASGLELTLFNWLVMAKLTADRAGLLACQDINIAITTLLKLAGLTEEYITNTVIEDFLIQARDFAAHSFGSLNQVTKILSCSDMTLTWTTMRAGELLKWYDSGEYERVIQQQDYSSSTNQDVKDENEEAGNNAGSTIADPQTGDWNFLSSW
jgi:hypothetical protein